MAGLHSPLQASSFLVTFKLNHHPWQVVLAIAAVRAATPVL